MAFYRNWHFDLEKMSRMNVGAAFKRADEQIHQLDKYF